MAGVFSGFSGNRHTFCSAEFYPSHIHQISAMYTDPDRSDRILHELDVYRKVRIRWMRIAFQRQMRDRKGTGAPMTAPVLRRWRTYVELGPLGSSKYLLVIILSPCISPDPFGGWRLDWSLAFLCRNISTLL